MYKVRLQKVVRRNGYVQYYVTLPRRLVEELGWNKRDELVVESIIIGADAETGKEWRGLVLINPRDCYRVFPSFYCDGKSWA